MLLYTSALILLPPSFVTSSIKMSEPVSEATMHGHAMTLLPQGFTDEVICLGSFAVPPNLCYFDKG